MKQFYSSLFTKCQTVGERRVTLHIFTTIIYLVLRNMMYALIRNSDCSVSTIPILNQ